MQAEAKAKSRYQFLPIRSTKIQNTDNLLPLHGCVGQSHICWCECKMALLLWRGIWQYLTNLNAYLYSNLVTHS